MEVLWFQLKSSNLLFLSRDLSLLLLLGGGRDSHRVANQALVAPAHFKFSTMGNSVATSHVGENAILRIDPSFGFTGINFLSHRYSCILLCTSLPPPATPSPPLPRLTPMRIHHYILTLSSICKLLHKNQLRSAHHSTKRHNALSRCFISSPKYFFSVFFSFVHRPSSSHPTPHSTL